jgi:Flp pilus assembly protein TadG
VLLGRGVRDASGASTVEFALVIPLLLLLILAMVDFGKAFNYYIDETHLANEAARWAMVDKSPTSATIDQAVKNQADTTELRNGGSTTSINSPGVTITFCYTGAGNVGDAVKATSTATYHWLSFLTGSFGIPGLGDKTITATATMRLEHKYDGVAYTASACP